ncbi:hypothetical protein E6C27_scaffold270G001320 [Cucumis melo var. makuwa]|uniref:Uncharacterized protein n=1 Tax=Cucumis melo var. makuwa TaxID=1194695 RepID=A0A5A7T7S8_CUCMM|nr:hypothetical protein E6C27_scaffold270G001320 [Cucumis melo var. makuwa]
MRTRHDSTISMDKGMQLYCIMEEILVNLGEIIYEHIYTTSVKDEIFTITSLNRKINLHENKIEDKRLKTKKAKKVDEDDEVEIGDEEERKFKNRPH